MRLLKQEIDVYAQLGDESHNSKTAYKLGTKRANNTIKFMKDNGIDLTNKTVLDVAGPSVLGKYAAEKSKKYFYTTGELDETKWTVNTKDKVDVVLFWEVLEHLLNPLLFLTTLKSKCQFDYCVVTFPTRPSWLWTNLHFHEMRLDRFEYLCKRAGYKIVAYKYDKIPCNFGSVFKGIRPLIRYFYNPHLNVIIKPI